MEKIIVSCLESRVEANRSIYARFLLGPFTDDHAVTIATALRRALLSKVKSTGITAIHIQGITHEFSTIVGLRESILDLALNFQQIVFRSKIESQITRSRTHKDLPRFLHGIPQAQPKEQKRFSSYSAISHKKVDENQDIQNQSSEVGLLSHFKKYGNTQFVLKNKRLEFCKKVGNHFVSKPPLKHTNFLSDTTRIGYLQIRGPAVIYANDLKLPLGIECVDPTQYIATLSTEGLLVVKFLIGKKKVFFYHDHDTSTIKKLNTGRAKLMQKSSKFFTNKSIDSVRQSDTQFRYMQNGVLQTSLPQQMSSPLFDYVTLEGEKELREDETSLDTQFANEASLSDRSYRSFAKASLLQRPRTRLNKIVRPRLLEHTSDFGKNNNTTQKQGIESKGKIKNNFDEEKSDVLPLCFDNVPLKSKAQEANPKERSFVPRTLSKDSLRNTIFLDPILDSVSQVNYIIEKDDLSNQPRERIVLELWTNGSVHPRQAIHQASLSLMSTFSIFRKMFHVYSW